MGYPCTGLGVLLSLGGDCAPGLPTAVLGTPKSEYSPAATSGSCHRDSPARNSLFLLLKLLQVLHSASFGFSSSPPGPNIYCCCGLVVSVWCFFVVLEGLGGSQEWLGLGRTFQNLSLQTPGEVWSLGWALVTLPMEGALWMRLHQDLMSC